MVKVLSYKDKEKEEEIMRKDKRSIYITVLTQYNNVGEELLQFSGLH